MRAPKSAAVALVCLCLTALLLGGCSAGSDNSFVSLAAPHIARRLVPGTGTDPVTAAAVGATLLVGADWVAACALPITVPVSAAPGPAGGCVPMPRDRPGTRALPVEDLLMPLAGAILGYVAARADRWIAAGGARTTGSGGEARAWDSRPWYARGVRPCGLVVGHPRLVPAGRRPDRAARSTAGASRWTTVPTYPTGAPSPHRHHRFDPTDPAAPPVRLTRPPHSAASRGRRERST